MHSKPLISPSLEAEQELRGKWGCPQRDCPNAASYCDTVHIPDMPLESLVNRRLPSFRACFLHKLAIIRAGYGSYQKAANAAGWRWTKMDKICRQVQAATAAEYTKLDDLYDSALEHIARRIREKEARKPKTQ